MITRQMYGEGASSTTPTPQTAQNRANNPSLVDNRQTVSIHPLTGQIDEVWKPLSGFEAFLEVSNSAQVRHCKTGRIEPQFKKGSQWVIALYHPVTGKYTYVAIHRAVAKAFVPNPNNYQWVKRTDGNKHNNRAANLVWVPSPQQKAAKAKAVAPTPQSRPNLIAAIEDCMAPTFSANATLSVVPVNAVDYASLVGKVVAVVVKAKLFAYYLGRVVAITDDEVLLSRDNPAWPNRIESRSVIAGIAKVVSVLETQIC